MVQHNRPCNKLNRQTHGQSVFPFLFALQTVRQLFSSPANGKHCSKGELKGAGKNNKGIFKRQADRCQRHGGQKIIGSAQIRRGKGAGKHQTGTENRRAESRHGSIEKKKPSAPHSGPAKSQPQTPEQTIKSHSY